MSTRIRQAGPWYDPHCRRCDYGWIDATDHDGHNTTKRCPDCQARAEFRQPGNGRAAALPPPAAAIPRPRLTDEAVAAHAKQARAALRNRRKTT